MDEIYDASMIQMQEAIREFGRKIEKGGDSVAYYAGHGIEYQKETYLL